MALGKNIPSSNSLKSKNVLEVSPIATKEPAMEHKGWVEAAELSQINQDIGKNRKKSEKKVLVTFKIGRERYAIDIDQVREVVKKPELAVIPQSPEYILGVVNIRGSVFAVVDLYARFSQKAVPNQGEQFVLVIKDEEIRVCLLVDQVPETITVEKDDIDFDNAAVSNIPIEDNHINGIVKVDSQMIILIDPIKMIE